MHDADTAKQILAAGGRLLGDYGGYQLYEAARLPPELEANIHVESRDDYNVVLLNVVSLDTTKAAAQEMRRAVVGGAGKRLHMVQFVGPVQPAWRDQLSELGFQIVAYVPHNAYLLYGGQTSISSLQAKASTAPHIQWEGPYRDDFKIHPAGLAPAKTGFESEVQSFVIQIVQDEGANAVTLQLLQRISRTPVSRLTPTLHYLNLLAHLTPADVAQVAAQPEVVSILPYWEPRKLCERQDQIVAGNLNGNIPAGPGYLAWLAAKGFTEDQFTASGFAVDMSDSGIDNGTTSPNHFGLHSGGALSNASRVVYSRLEGSPSIPSTLSGCDGHGTLNAHIVGGYVDLSGFPHTDTQGFHFGLGVCPFVRLGASVIFDPDNFTSPNFNDLQSDAYDSGARISNNSWASGSSGVYDPLAQLFDALVRDAQPDGSRHGSLGNQEMVIVLAAGNSGPTAQSVGSPATAKNIISVGAAENVQPFGGADASGITDADADSAYDVGNFSARGPCADGRHKPELLAPGTHVSGGVAQAPDPGPVGTADPCYDGNGVSGGTNWDIFYPGGQQFYTASSGTSHATPCVSGACALLRQFFINNFSNPPSPAITKAYLVNSARYLAGAGANDTLWSDTQGMGELDLGRAFDGVPRILRDQMPEDLFTSSGQVRSFIGVVADTNKPVRVTLAWTDAPGSTFGAAFNNDLDLIVVAGGQRFFGNAFAGSNSIAGGSPDSRNNVESVFLPAGTVGNFMVQILANDINSDGVPNNAFALDQDFALVIYNGNPSEAPIIEVTGTSLIAEGCSPTNGVIDPGERATFAIGLQNVGAADTTNLWVTLLEQAGVQSPSAPQHYGMLAGGGAAATNLFSFTAEGACGSIITPTFELRDASTILGFVTLTFRLGVASALTPLAEHFDSATPPRLPNGWTNFGSGSVPTWGTVDWTSVTAPNSASCVDSANPGVSELISPGFMINSDAGRVSFANSYDLEWDPGMGFAYDGGVMELSIGNGPFIDVLGAGGTFTTGGYNMTLDNSSDNPFAGRRVWSGNSGGFITTTVSLPATAAGQTVQLKWRLGTDSGNMNGGSAWYVDDVVVQDTIYSCCIVLQPPAITAIDVSKTNVIVTCSSSVGRRYLLQTKDSLEQEWRSLPPAVSGTGNPISIQDNRAPSRQSFYRVQCN